TEEDGAVGGELQTAAEAIDSAGACYTSRASGGGHDEDKKSQGFLGRRDVYRLRPVLHDLGTDLLPDGHRGAHGSGVFPDGARRPVRPARRVRAVRFVCDRRTAGAGIQLSAVDPDQRRLRALRLSHEAARAGRRDRGAGLRERARRSRVQLEGSDGPLRHPHRVLVARLREGPDAALPGVARIHGLLSGPAMEIFHNLWIGFQVAVHPINVMYCFIGVILGTLIGVLPGIGPVATIAMLLPITFNLNPVAALII